MVAITILVQRFRSDERWRNISHSYRKKI